MMAGGGIKPGTVYGASDKTGAFPSDKPTSPGELISTMYHLLGVDSRYVLYDRNNKPFHVVPDGEPIRDLIV